MKKITPDDDLRCLPCSAVSLITAYREAPECTKTEIFNMPKVRETDGYASLNAMNKEIRNTFCVKKRHDYKRGERPLLKDLSFDGKAFVCVFGHFLYLDNDTYYSFFDNENDEVVAVWVLKNNTTKYR